MENKNLENTVKKMAIVLEKVVKKVDELDKRVQRLEMKMLAKEGSKSENLPQQNISSHQTQQSSPSGSGFGSFGTGFLSSLLGSFAGMSLFNLLFNNSVSAEEVAREAGVADDTLAEIEEKLDSIDEKLTEIDEKLSEDEVIDTASIDFDTVDTDVDTLDTGLGYEDIDADFGFDDFDTDIV